MERIGVGIIGSQFAAELHAEALGRLRDVALVAVASPTENHVRDFAERHHVAHWFTDYRDLLAMDAIDMVILTLPNYLHAQACVDAAAAGKHVVCEKPLCLNLEEADRMIEACRVGGVKLMYAETLAFTPKYRRAKELADVGALGKLHLIKQAEKHDGPHSPWFWDVDLSGGGATFDLGCHGIEYCRYVMNKEPVTSVYAHMNQFMHSARTEGDDHALIAIEFVSGAIGVIEASWCHPGGMDDRVELHGNAGSTYADLLHGNALTTFSTAGYEYAVEKAAGTKGWTFTVYDEIGAYGFPEEDRHFVGCVREGLDPIENGEDGKAVLEIVMAAYESARTGRKVKLPFRPKVKKPIDLWQASADQ